MNGIVVKPPAPEEAAFTHREAIAALSEAELTQLKQTSDAPGLVRLAAYLGLLALTGLAVLWAPNWALWLVAATAHGILLMFLFTLEHEAIHGTAFRTAWLNRAVAAAAGFVVFAPALWFRYFHFAHHRHTQDPENDPELASPKPSEWRSYLIHLTGLPYWKAEFATILSVARGKVGNYVPPAAAPRVVAEARIHLGLYGLVALLALAFGWTWPLTLWIVPALLGQPFLRAYLLAEHGACPLVADMLANTRTTYTNAVVRFLAWNMPYHTAHHVLPVVPFHRLARLTSLLEGRLASTARGYPEAHAQIRRSWDVRNPEGRRLAAQFTRDAHPPVKRS